MRRFWNVLSRLVKWSVLSGATFGFIGYWLVRYFRPRYSPLVLNGSIVVITGASSGIGRAYAEAFARRGTRLVLNARRADLLDELRREIEPYAADVLVIPGDLRDDSTRDALIQQTMERFGRISILVNCAGLLAAGPLELAASEHIDALISVNLAATIDLTRRALPTMLNRGRGVIINVASIAGKVPYPAMAVYSASKAGLLGFSTALRREVFGTDVQVISVIPGYTRTEMIGAHFISYARRLGLSVFEPGEVAEATIRGLFNGAEEVYLTGFVARVFMWLDQHFPALTSLLLRAINTPAHLDEITHQADQR